MKGLCYTPATKMSDILKDNFRKYELLNLLGIKHGFDDDASVMEVCNTYDVNLDLFLHICNLYTFDDYSIENNITGEFSIDHATDYILKVQYYFIHVNLARIKEDYNEIKPIQTKSFSELFDVFLDVINEDVTSCQTVFARYEKDPRSISSDQIEQIFSLGTKANLIVDTLIKQLSELSVPEEYKTQVDHLKFYLIFIRSDFDRHNSLKRLTLNLLVN